MRYSIKYAGEIMQIIHIDMDAFFAAVEIRDDPSLEGKPVVIGSLPGERGVVSTCNYEARKYGIRSAMPISEAYRRCPTAVFMHGNGHKYHEASQKIRKIWETYTDICEYISLDEGFLDVTHSAHLFGGAVAIAHEIKRRTVEEVNLTCSVGIGYSMMSAKLASEEKKPDGFFEIPTAEALRDLIIDRNVRVIYGVGAKTAEQLARVGITTVRHIYENKELVKSMFGKMGPEILKLAEGVDPRKVTTYAKQKSIGTEHTFQTDISDFAYLKDVLLLLARKLSFDIKTRGIYATTITIKATYANMNMLSVTRSKTGDATNNTNEIHKTACALLEKIDKRPVRLIGISLSNLTDKPKHQLTLFDVSDLEKREKFDEAILKMQMKHGQDIIKTAVELQAEKTTYT